MGYLLIGVAATMEEQAHCLRFSRVNDSPSDILAAMTECSDRRQIRVRYQGPRNVRGQSAGAVEDVDEVALMLGCSDPRQIRVHYASSPGHHVSVA